MPSPNPLKVTDAILDSARLKVRDGIVFLSGIEAVTIVSAGSPSQLRLVIKTASNDYPMPEIYRDMQDAESACYMLTAQIARERRMWENDE